MDTTLSYSDNFFFRVTMNSISATVKCVKRAFIWAQDEKNPSREQKVLLHKQLYSAQNWIKKGPIYELKISLDGFFVAIAQMKALLMLYLEVLMDFMVTQKNFISV